MTTFLAHHAHATATTEDCDLARLVGASLDLGRDDASEVVRTIVAMFEAGALGAEESLVHLARLGAARSRAPAERVVHAARAILASALPALFGDLHQLAQAQIARFAAADVRAGRSGCPWPEATCAAIRAHHVSRAR